MLILELWWPPAELERFADKREDITKETFTEDGWLRTGGTLPFCLYHHWC